MRTGVLMEAQLSRLVPCVLSMFLLLHLSRAAPGQPGSQREEPDNSKMPSGALVNPFGFGEEERGLLKSYVKSSLKDGEGGPEINTWEQEVFFLFGLYDYDRSGFLDGLEMMKLLFDFNSHHATGAQANEKVVSMVDFLLQTQDLNQDGLLAPSELLSPPLARTQESGNNQALHQDQDVVLEEKLSHPLSDQEAAGEKEEPLEESQPIQETDGQNGHQDREAPAAEQRHEREVPVHQGQPEKVIKLVSAARKKIRQAFEAFDDQCNNTVDVREISTIIYSLGRFPSQADLHKFIAEVEEDHAGSIHWDRFLPAMTKVLLENKFPPISEDVLLQAFEVLDKGKRGYLEPEELTKYMTQEGEPFTQEEMEEMLTALTDPEKNQIDYKDLISQLAIDDM
ncbi:dynein regulatory complex protein 8 [Aulostomus maculatus]